MTNTSERTSHERVILWLLGSVMFINIVDFMMVMPLGPDFAAALGIPAAHLGWISGSYTFASSFAGLIGAFFLDRFERRRVLLFCLGGLIITTAICGFTWNFESLVAARILTGLFGGPLFSLSLAIVADTFEPARRGQAMGKIMGAFSLAAIAGVPFGLEMARHFHWNTPFFFLSGAAFVILLVIALRFPRMDAHLLLPQPVRNLHYFKGLALKPGHFAALGFVMANMMASFLIIPNISAYLQFNLGYPRASMGLLYFCGGLASLAAMRVAGLWIDRTSSTRVAACAVAIVSAVLIAGFWMVPPALPVLAIFVLFMLAMSMRNVSTTTLSSKIPIPQERAGFMALLSCVQNFAMAMGAFIASLMLTEDAETHVLVGMPSVVVLSVGLSILGPVFMANVEARVRRNAAETVPIVPLVAS